MHGDRCFGVASNFMVEQWRVEWSRGDCMGARAMLQISSHHDCHYGLVPSL